MTKNVLLINLLIIVTHLGSSCTTLFNSDKKVQDKPHSEIIVQKAGFHQNQIDGKEKNYWVKVNQTSKKDSTKMVASLASGDASSSEIHARNQLRKTPGHKRALAVLTAALAQKKNFAMASFYAKQLLKRDPENSLALNVIGLSHLMTANATMSDFRNAKAFFEKSISASGREIAAVLNLAYLHLELGRPDLAYDSFSEASKRCSGCFYAAIGRGISASRTGKYEVAKSEFEGILSQDENNGEAMYRLALVRKNGYNDLKGARELLDQLINQGKAGENLKRRAYVLARKIEDTRDPTAIASDNGPSGETAEGDMDSLYKAMDSE